MAAETRVRGTTYGLAMVFVRVLAIEGCSADDVTGLHLVIQHEPGLELTRVEFEGDVLGSSFSFGPEGSTLHASSRMGETLEDGAMLVFPEALAGRTVDLEVMGIGADGAERARGSASAALAAGTITRVPVALRSVVCGDGLVGWEACDDGNSANGDGCSSLCEIEAPHPQSDASIAGSSAVDGGIEDGSDVPPPPMAVDAAMDGGVGDAEHGDAVDSGRHGDAAADAGRVDGGEDGASEDGAADVTDASSVITSFGYTPRNLSAEDYAPSGAVDLSNCPGDLSFDSSGAGTYSSNWCGFAPRVETALLGSTEAVVLTMSALMIGSQTRLRLRGARPIIFLVYGDAIISGAIDASASHSEGGPGTARTTCSGSDGATSMMSGAGGGGGGFRTSGKEGGRSATFALGGIGGPSSDDPTILLLEGGSRGGMGGAGAYAGGLGGGGGGAIQLSVAGTMVITGVMASGGGGGGAGSLQAGGGGGGSGGAILLEADDLEIEGTLAANGGAGGGGGKNVAGDPESSPGEDGKPSLEVAGGGTGTGGMGGTGGCEGTEPERGTQGTRFAGGGGGGGSVGRIHIYARRACAIASGAVMSPDATTSGSCP